LDLPKSLDPAASLRQAIGTNRQDSQFSRKPIRRKQNEDRRQTFKNILQLYFE